jgi:hypothetical protein
MQGKPSWTVNRSAAICSISGSSHKELSCVALDDYIVTPDFVNHSDAHAVAQSVRSGYVPSCHRR